MRKILEWLSGVSKLREFVIKRIGEIEAKLQEFVKRAELYALEDEVRRLRMEFKRAKEEFRLEAEKEVQEFIDVERKLFKSEVMRILERIKEEAKEAEEYLEALKRCREFEEDYQRFRVEVEGELVRIKDKLAVLEAEVLSLRECCCSNRKKRGKRARRYGTVRVHVSVGGDVVEKAGN